MKIVIIGAGNIGLVTALCFAERGHEVLCIEQDQIKVQQLNRGQLHLHEKDLQNLLDRALSQKTIHFSDNLHAAIDFSSIFFICVGTPSLPDGSADLSQINNIIQQFNDKNKTNPNQKNIFVIKSTVPPGTTDSLSQKNPHLQFVFNPEFLKEGTAVQDALFPDRIVIGCENDALTVLMKKIYETWIEKKIPFVVMNASSAEMTKYASNVFLAARISLMNELANLCLHSHANIESVANGVGLDSRIGPHFLKAGLGYGGSCFPKDLAALQFYAQKYDLQTPMMTAIQKTNDEQVLKFTKKIVTRLSQLNSSQTKNQIVTVWGLAFKPDTNDIREAPALKILEALLQNHFHVQIYDPTCNEKVIQYFQQHKKTNAHLLKSFLNPYEALEKSQALIIATEWHSFIEADLELIKEQMSTPLIFDGRNIYQPILMKKWGFEYYSIGRPS